MEWRDDGILIGTQPHGEGGLILDVFTAAHGRRRGLVRGGASAKRAAEFQIGAQLSLRWRARLETHLGQFQAEARRVRAGFIIDRPLALSALAAAAALLSATLPEGDPHPDLHDATDRLLDAIAAPDGSETRWTALYAAWELQLLDAIGFGLDLSTCAATGGAQNLIYVSPRSGRAVSADAGAPFHAKLLALPPFLRLGDDACDPAGFHAALTLTGHFLGARAAPALNMEVLPSARERLARLAATRAAPLRP